MLKERDLFSVPPGVYRGLVNEGIEEALMCVIIGNTKPVTPTYPPDHPLAKIKRPKGGGAGCGAEREGERRRRERGRGASDHRHSRPGRWRSRCRSSAASACVKALGRNLVLWRDTQGKLNCLEDYCPHRGARLSRGEVNADNISCRSPGVTLDGSGTIVDVPAMPGCALEGRRPSKAIRC